MKTQAAVLVQIGKPLEILDLEIPPLHVGQVLVEMCYSGVCHTQLLECRGFRGEDRYLPHCLGHEGSGVVREVSQGVSKVKVGEHVILSWMKGQGMEAGGSRYKCNGLDVNAGAVTTFSKWTVASENRLFVVPDNLGLQEAALLGCAVPTGLGTIFNTANPRPGQSLAVFGCGGIGSCAVAGAHLAGCDPIFAVDIHPDKLKISAELGANHLIDASRQHAAEEIHKLLPEGCDFAIEASGRPPVMRQAVECVKPRGGTAIIIGNAPFGETFTIDPRQLNLGKKILGTWGGDNVPEVHFPRYIQFVTAKKLKLDFLLARKRSLSEINEALFDLESGKVLRPLVDLALP